MPHDDDHARLVVRRAIDLVECVHDVERGVQCVAFDLCRIHHGFIGRRAHALDPRHVPRRRRTGPRLVHCFGVRHGARQRCRECHESQLANELSARRPCVVVLHRSSGGYRAAFRPIFRRSFSMKLGAFGSMTLISMEPMMAEPLMRTVGASGDVVLAIARCTSALPITASTSLSTRRSGGTMICTLPMMHLISICEVPSETSA